MADSESKARRKLEEADKKTRGGGGFFGKLFGGSGSDEAADLYIQRSDYVGLEGQSADEPIIHTCLEKSCGMDFPDIVSFEDHYHAAHSHQCLVCQRKYPSEFLLSLHSDEVHCPFFRLRIENDPSGFHYRCYREDCQETFKVNNLRDAHCQDEHGISNPEVCLEKRKIPQRRVDPEELLDNLKIRKKNKTPASFKFGDTQEITFEKKKSIAVAWHRQKH